MALTFWSSPNYASYLGSLFEGDGGPPLKPGRILKPTLGPRSKLRGGRKIAGKKAKKNPKGNNLDDPLADAPPGPKPDVKPCLAVLPSAR